jgi:peptidoglycan/LPS O-acetylase OafA/YrhL
MGRPAINGSGHVLSAAAASLRQGSGRWSAGLAGKDENSFDAIRLFLATLVVFEHSFFLIENRYDSEPFYLLTHGQFNSGAIAVCMFFAISGFLVTRSWLLTGDVRRYLLKRIARIVPGFLVASFVACVLIAPLTTTNSVSYFVGQKWPALLVQAIALRQVSVSGILDGNAVRLIHGTLWTIQIEFDCYLALAVFGSLGMLKRQRAWALYLLLMVVLVAARAGWVRLPVLDHGFFALLISSPDQWPALIPFFIAGSAFYVYQDYVPKWLPLFGGSLLLLVVSSWWGGLYWALLLGGTYTVIYLALSSSLEMKVLGRRTDLSYGVYLYGWPVGQLLLYLSHQSLAPIPLFLLTMAVTLPVAYASWSIVEAPSLVMLRRKPALAAA